MTSASSPPSATVVSAPAAHLGESEHVVATDASAASPRKRSQQRASKAQSKETAKEGATADKEPSKPSKANDGAVDGTSTGAEAVKESKTRDVTKSKVQLKAKAKTKDSATKEASPREKRAKREKRTPTNAAEVTDPEPTAASTVSASAAATAGAVEGPSSVDVQQKVSPETKKSGAKKQRTAKAAKSTVPSSSAAAAISSNLTSTPTSSAAVAALLRSSNGTQTAPEETSKSGSRKGKQKNKAGSKTLTTAAPSSASTAAISHSIDPTPAQGDELIGLVSKRGDVLSANTIAADSGNGKKKSSSKKKKTNKVEPIKGTAEAEATIPPPSDALNKKALDANIASASVDSSTVDGKQAKSKGSKKSHLQEGTPSPATTSAHPTPDTTSRKKKTAKRANMTESDLQSNMPQQDGAAVKDNKTSMGSHPPKVNGDSARPPSLSSSAVPPVSPTASTASAPASPLPSSHMPPHPLSPDNSSVAPNQLPASRTDLRMDPLASSPPRKDSRSRESVKIKTAFGRDPSAPSSATFSAGLGNSLVSPLTSASPISRRSSALLSDKFGRHAGGLATVDENASERPPTFDFMGNAPLENPTPTAGRRGHVRSMSMKDPLIHPMAGREGDKEVPKTVESIHEILKSLKELAPAGHSSSSSSHQGPFAEHGQTSRHERRLSMSSLSSRNSLSAGSANQPTSTVLHISQPPPGMNITHALQSTVATMRRLSLSESRKSLLPLREEQVVGNEPVRTAEKGVNRRSVSYAAEPATSTNRRSAMMASTDKTLSGYQPNRRSVIIRPEEVAALQEGRAYVPATLGSFANEEEPDAVADALSALEGKGPASNRSSYSSKNSHQATGSNVNAESLAEFAAGLPLHMKGVAGAPLVNNDDAQDRRRFTTAFQSQSFNSRRVSALPLSNGQSIAPTTSRKRLSLANGYKESDTSNWRLSTPALHSNRDSVSFKDGAGGRRPLFAAHLTYSDFHSLLTKQKDRYVQGILRINKRNRSDAYVTVDSLPDGDVYICGSKDRNRALEGDVVGIELIDPEDIPPQKLDGTNKERKSRRQEEADELGEADVEESRPKYHGRVVSIVERSTAQLFSGTLTLQRPSGSTKKSDRKKPEDLDKDLPRIVWFKPTDKRVPLVAIPIDQVPGKFIEDHTNFVHKLFVASIKRWPLSSLHPFGQLERQLGDIGNIEIETEALLANNNVITTAFGEKVEKCLPGASWTIPEEEIRRRRDLRSECIFTIDPATAKDLDDAVSCKPLEDGTYEIGVHIADVSHFVKSGSALDKEAKSRATTVYLVQKAIPMLPNLLCEDLCSLNAQVERLAFSVFWKMTESGEILETTFDKSVIRSCAQLSYDDAQNVISTGSLDPKIEVLGQPRSLVENNIKMFYKLSQILRKKRFDNGALSIQSIRLAFEMDSLCNPMGVSVYQIKESNRLIEEFMLLANMSVAKKICETFPDQALLRKHDQPLEKRMTEFIQHMNKIGIKLNTTSSKTLQESLDAIQDPAVRDVIRLLVIKPMQRAKYICSGAYSPEKYHHYALNAPLYTHFTSPIRRYADIMVHRMLEASLVEEPKFFLTKEACQKTAIHCNIRKDASKSAQEQSSHVYLSVLIRNLTQSKGPVIKDAVVVQVQDASFDVLVPEYGLEKRIYVDQLPLERHGWTSSTEMLKLYWTTEPFKTADKLEEETKTGKDGPNALLLCAEEVSADHPDDATNAYDAEQELFADESDSEDDEEKSAKGTVAIEEEEEDGGAEGSVDDTARRVTRVRIFSRVKVLITADTNVSPALIKAIALNPFAATEDDKDTTEAATA